MGFVRWSFFFCRSIYLFWLLSGKLKLEGGSYTRELVGEFYLIL